MAEMGIRMEQERLLQKHGSLSFLDIVNSNMGQTFLLIAGVLFILILTAGVLMISSSINSTVAQRTKFFGMMRCIGMSKEQISLYVRLEALNWCKGAIPIGVGLGILSTWGLCGALRFLVGEEFSNIPLLGVSGIGIISGTVVGLVTVLLAAIAPARRAAKVSPITALSGNTEKKTFVPIGKLTRVFKVETALGMNHALSAKKNLFFMTGSLALSIILFFTFAVLIDFVGYLMPQSSSTADFTITSKEGTNTINSGLADTIRSMEGVKRVFGRRSLLDTIDIISFDVFDLNSLKKDKMLKKGSDLDKVYGDSNFVLATWDENSLLKKGDVIRVGSEELVIAGLLKYDPFNSDGTTDGKITLITSAKTFERVTGITDYSLLMIQTTNELTEETILRMQAAVGKDAEFHDLRDQSTAGTYLAFVFCMDSFLIIITLVAVLNLINSISMSVSAKIKQYGEMRAIGMDMHQITKMITMEAVTYAVIGTLFGCGAGLLLSRMLFQKLIAAHFAYAYWQFPMKEILLMCLVVMFTVAAAVYAPSKRTRNLAITDTINEL
jgi:ABC-type antimicrobial peptide transport system permease subunit